MSNLPPRAASASASRSTSQAEPAGRGGDAPDQADELVEAIVRGLETRGVPPGTWLVDIARVRHALQEADGLLRRLEAAVTRAADSSPLDE